MKNDANLLPNDLVLLQQMLLAEREEVQVWQHKYNRLLEQFRISQKQRFGSSTETNPYQDQLFDEAEAINTETLEETVCADESETEITIAEPRQKPKRKPLPADLPRETVIIDIPESEKTCTCCGHELHKMGEETSEKLEKIPASLKVIKQVRLKYTCRHCEQHGTQNSVKIAPVPVSIIPKGIATASLIAFIIINKFLYALPLYRQETLFDQMGIDLSRQTMSRWMIVSAEALLRIYAALRQHLLKQHVIHSDDTPLQVIQAEKSNRYMWVYCSGSDSTKTPSFDQRIVLYESASREGIHPKTFLQGFTGTLQCDGYAGYNGVVAPKQGCWAHARRYFVEADTALGKDLKSKKIGWALNCIGKLYAIEKRIANKSIEDRFAIRQEESKPLLSAYKKWLDDTASRTILSEKLKDAVNYSLNQWEELSYYINDGRLNIDNNRAERAIKPFVIGRKNWLFSNTVNGANASAILYSIVQTAKANGVRPLEYLTHLLTELPKIAEGESVEHLMPWNVQLEIVG